MGQIIDKNFLDVGELLYEMRRRAPQEKRPFYGLATLCVGVGQGEATIVEWLD